MASPVCHVSEGEAFHVISFPSETAKIVPCSSVRYTFIPRSRNSFNTFACGNPYEFPSLQLITENFGDTASQKLIQALDDKKVDYFTPIPGEVYSLGSAEFTILAPINTYSDPNNASIALLLKNGDTTFLFTGDAEEEAEEDIVESGRSIQADVYHAGHHGSKTASSEILLDAVSPKFSVISCKEGNSYGFPHAKVVNEFRDLYFFVNLLD